MQLIPIEKFFSNGHSIRNAREALLFQKPKQLILVVLTSEKKRIRLLKKKFAVCFSVREFYIFDL